MHHDADARLVTLGLELPQPAPAIAAYVPYVLADGFLYVSGQLPIAGGAVRHVGRVGETLDVAAGAAAARLCALNLLAQVRAALGGELRGVRRVVKLVAFVRSAPGFESQPQVVDGASQLMLEVFGDAGRHARSAVGVGELPRGAAVEIEAVFAVDPGRGGS